MQIWLTLCECIYQITATRGPHHSPSIVVLKTWERLGDPKIAASHEITAGFGPFFHHEITSNIAVFFPNFLAVLQGSAKPWPNFLAPHGELDFADAKLGRFFVVSGLPAEKNGD